MKKLTSAVFAALLAAAVLLTAACPKRTSIADIERDPARFQNKEVAVAGIVRDSYGLSIPGTRIGGGAYKIDDGTGSIWVIVADGNVPGKGAEVGVRGTVGTGINYKGKNYGLGIYEKDRRYGKK